VKLLQSTDTCFISKKLKMNVGRNLETVFKRLLSAIHFRIFFFASAVEGHVRFICPVWLCN